MEADRHWEAFLSECVQTIRGDPKREEISEKGDKMNCVKRNGKHIRIISALLSLLLLILVAAPGMTVSAAPEIVGKGTVGLTFGGQTSVLCGETISGTVYSYDIGGTDAVSMSLTYDASAFKKLEVKPADGVTVLASEENDNQVNMVLMVDPETTDYSKLLTVTAAAGDTEAVGAISISACEAAKEGNTVAITIAQDDNTISVVSDELIEEFTIETLSKAMTYFMVDSTNAKWAEAAKYDMDENEVINLNDFVKIANAILDSQRIGKLQFGEDGRFKIMQISDIQDYVNDSKPSLNEKTTALINAALDAEAPDLVVITGDQIGGNMNGDQVQSLIDQIAQPFEERQILWLVTFGNHDEDAVTALNEGWNKIKQLSYYRSFQYNINRASMSGVQGYTSNGKNTIAVGDMYQLIYDKEGKNPIYNIWALDSNRYEDSGTGIGGYDWIRTGQIQWYTDTSKMLEAKYGEKINSLMFFHIPTPEWSDMWDNKDKFNVVGEKNEEECPPNINSGMFTAALERGDVRGMFVGHDHVNNYTGNYYGIQLGYDANAGYQTYDLGGADNDRLRGVRVFELDENNLETFTTRMVTANDLGVNQ